MTEAAGFMEISDVSPDSKKVKPPAPHGYLYPPDKQKKATETAKDWAEKAT